MIGKDKSLKEICDISSKEVLNLHNNWLKWLLNQNNYTVDTNITKIMMTLPFRRKGKHAKLKQ